MSRTYYNHPVMVVSWTWQIILWPNNPILFTFLMLCNAPKYCSNRFCEVFRTFPFKKRSFFRHFPRRINSLQNQENKLFISEGLGSVLTRKKYWPLIGRKEKVIEQQVWPEVYYQLNGSEKKWLYKIHGIK